jgi:hypothetical protein
VERIGKGILMLIVVTSSSAGSLWYNKFQYMFYHVFPSLIGKEKHYSLAQQICLFPAVLREHLENRRTNKLLNIRRDDVSKPIALLDQIQGQIFSLKELDVSAPCRVISRHANEW